jgi:outer membrane immunogenic protein
MPIFPVWIPGKSCATADDARVEGHVPIMGACDRRPGGGAARVGAEHGVAEIRKDRLGCNWQPVGSAFVLGVEGEGGYMKLKGSAFDPLISPTLTVAAFRGTPDVLGSAQAGSWYAMATGRLGYAFDHFLAFDHVLAYVKGGAAFLPIRGSILDNCLNVAAGCGNWVISTATSETLATGTIGGGLEWAFAPNWSIKAEYMFIGLGDHSITSCGTSHSGATLAVTPGGDFCFNHEFPGIHTGKIGINFHFGP